MGREHELEAVERLRQVCLALPEVSERQSHGSPSWFIRQKRTLASLDDHHHGKDHLAFWCPAAPGVQEELVEEEPARFFRPPYVGVNGWIGVRIDATPDWAEVSRIIEEAFRLVAPKRLVLEMDT